MGRCSKAVRYRVCAYGGSYLGFRVERGFKLAGGSQNLDRLHSKT